jgi:predicted nucleic acid-binding Zn ribbon protein
MGKGRISKRAGQPKVTNRKCIMCGTQLLANQKKYCSYACSNKSKKKV